MKIIRLVSTYIVMGAATAFGHMTVEKLSEPYNRMLLKIKFKSIINKFKKGR